MVSHNGDGAQLIDSSIARQFERLPPHSIEAEMCLIASMMLDGSKDTVGQVVQLVDEDAFFQADHQILYRILRQLYEGNRSIDAMIVREELIKRQLLEEVGGIEYLAAILSSVPNAANGVHYAGIVKEKALLRQLIAASSEILREAYAPHERAEDVLDAAERRIFQIAERKVAGQLTRLEESLHEVFDAIESHAQRGLETGFFELDDMLNGLQRSEMIVLAARPSMGKTSLAMNLVEHAAVVSQQPCAVFSLEMSKQQLAQRMLCSYGQVDGQRLRRGMLRGDEYAKIASVVGELAAAPIWVDDSPGLTPLELRTKCRRLRLQQDVKLVVVDYLQLMDAGATTTSRENRQQQISEISRGLKAVARELDVPVVALSQLNRLSENRDGHRPRMSDLRDSGSIEQDADVVMLLHREDYYRAAEPDFVPDNLAEVIIAKQRNGPTGTVKLAFNNKSTRFENLSTQADPF